MKVCKHCGTEIGTKDGDNACGKCQEIEDSGRRIPRSARENRKMIHDAMTSMGLVRVKGAIGGVYYE